MAQQLFVTVCAGAVPEPGDKDVSPWLSPDSAGKSLSSSWWLCESGLLCGVPKPILASLACCCSRLCFLHLILRFWNQTFTLESQNHGIEFGKVTEPTINPAPPHSPPNLSPSATPVVLNTSKGGDSSNSLPQSPLGKGKAWLLHGPLGSGSVQSIPDKMENCSQQLDLPGTQIPGSRHPRRASVSPAPFSWELCQAEGQTPPTSPGILPGAAGSGGGSPAPR